MANSSNIDDSILNSDKRRTPFSTPVMAEIAAAITNNINNRLEAAAGTIELVINDSLINMATGGEQPDTEQYRIIQNKVDRIAAIHAVDYAYVGILSQIVAEST